MIDEFAREYIRKHGVIEDIHQSYYITQKQCEREDHKQIGVDIQVTDSPVPLAMIYAIAIDNPKPGSRGVECWKEYFSLILTRHYNIIFHLHPFESNVEDGVRPALHLDSEWRKERDIILPYVFKLFPPDHFVDVSIQNVDRRIDYCIEIIKEFCK